MTEIPLSTLPSIAWGNPDLPEARKGMPDQVMQLYVQGLGLVRQTFTVRQQPRRGFPPFWLVIRAELLEPCPAGEEPAPFRFRDGMSTSDWQR